jgi:GT2 family glycosyltransferase
MASRETFRKLTLPSELGPFDATTFFLYYEDSDLGLRSQELGISFHQIPTPLIHFGKESSKLIDTSKWYQISRKKFLKKWKK